jgi:hypothetical protein
MDEKEITRLRTDLTRVRIQNRDLLDRIEKTDAKVREMRSALEEFCGICMAYAEACGDCEGVCDDCALKTVRPPREAKAQPSDGRWKEIEKRREGDES